MASGATTEFKPLAFRPVKGRDLRPPITGSDNTYGNRFVSGQLKSLQHANNAILFIVSFQPGADAKPGDPNCIGEVEYLVMRHKNRLVGKITRQAPSSFCSMTGDEEEFRVLDGMGSGPGIGGRHAANFFCAVKGYFPGEFSASAYFQRNLFGGWREIVIRAERDALYVARP
ncbi:MAG: hypothetical protein AB7H66_00450 [Hyphomonadaceae bacterium]